MQAPMAELSADVLLQHDTWLRKLVRGLIGDADADDVVQEVWRRAVARPPRDDGALPGWLATTARRLAWRHHRDTGRRRGREQVAAARGTPNTSEDPADLVARVEARQAITQAVLELDEPFRIVVLLRYFEGQEPAQIGARIGVPAATVRTRLHRAHDKLRARMEQRHGKGWRRRLALLCVPLPTLRPAPHPARPARSWLVATLILPLLGGAVWFAVDATGKRPVTPVPPGSTSAALETTSTVAPDPAMTQRSPAAPATTTTRRQKQGEPVCTGHARDARGRPLRGVPLFVHRRGEAPVQVATTDTDGRFSFTSAQTGALRTGSGWSTLGEWPMAGQPEDNALVIAAPTIRLAGRVVDEHQRPVPDALVEASHYMVFGFPESTAGTTLQSIRRSAQCDEAGRFTRRRRARVPSDDLEVLRQGPWRHLLSGATDRPRRSGPGAAHHRRGAPLRHGREHRC